MIGKMSVTKAHTMLIPFAQIFGLNLTNQPQYEKAVKLLDEWLVFGILPN